MMACGDFTCSKNALAALNVLYILVSFILIGVAAYGKAAALITSLTLMSGIIACGVFLLLVAIIGLVGAIKHHQVLLFFYMVILFMLFLVQFAVACACLAVNEKQQLHLATNGWRAADNHTRNTVQTFFDCCGFDDATQDMGMDVEMGHPSCMSLECCTVKDGSPLAACCNPEPTTNSTTTTTPSAPSADCTCHHCWEIIHEHMNSAFKIAGGIGLFFSFTEIIGVWLALRYRNQKDPRANPSAFL